MACLNDLISNKLKNASKGSICALHKFVFEKEGNRNNGKRLREFSGCQFDENDGVYKAKCVYVQAKLTERDLISICLILNISHDVENMQLHIFQNLRFDQLLGGNEVEDPEESDEDKDDDEENQSDDASDHRSYNQDQSLSPWHPIQDCHRLQCIHQDAGQAKSVH